MYLKTKFEFINEMSVKDRKRIERSLKFAIEKLMIDHKISFSWRKGNK